jgi:exonuclease SbcD
MGSERVTVGNIDAVFSDVLEPFDYAALGHIHKPMCVGSEYCRYSGTPLACSVSEAGQEKSVIVIEMKEKRPAGGQGDKTQSLNDGKENISDRNISIKKIRLKPLHEVREIKGTAVEVLMQACDDFISLTLTDKDDIDVIDIQDRLRAAFPNLLEIKREGIRTAVYDADIHEEVLHDPLELCEAFLGELDENEKGILGDVINKVKGVNR